MSSDYGHAIALAVPVKYLDDAHLMATALGWQEPVARSFGTPLSADGTPPATHYGLTTVAQAAFVAILMDPADTLVGTDWPAHGLTAARVQAVLAAMLMQVRPRSDGVEGVALMDEALAAWGLRRVVQDDSS